MFSKEVILCLVLAILFAGCTTQDRGRRPRRYRPLYEEYNSKDGWPLERDKTHRLPVPPQPVPPSSAQTEPQSPPAPPVVPSPSAQAEQQPPPAPPPQALPAAEVERLRTLLNLGFITKEEYEQKLLGQNAK